MRQYKIKWVKHSILSLTLLTSCMNSLQLHEAQTGNPEATVTKTVKALENITPTKRVAFGENTEILEYDLRDSNSPLEVNTLKLQVTDKETVAVIRSPKNKEEKTLAYWREKFKNNTTYYSPVNQAGHIKDLYALKNLENNLTIVYSEAREEVTEIINYDK